MSINNNRAAHFFDSQYFTFKTFGCGTDSYNEALIYALRYQVYCLERFFLAADDYPDGLEKDEYDDCSTFVSATNQSNDLIGGMRVVRPPEGMPFPFQQHCTHLFNEKSLPPARDCVEISRVVISKACRRRADDTVYGISSKLLEISPNQANITSIQNSKLDRKLHPEILLGILRQGYKHSKEIGVSHWYVAMERSLARMLLRINFVFEAIGEEVNYYGPVAPYILAINKFESDMSRNHPAMFDWFQSALDEDDVYLNTYDAHSEDARIFL